MPPRALSTWASSVVGIWANGTPRSSDAAAKPAGVAAGAATQRHHAAGTVKAAVQYPAAQGHPCLRRFGTLALGQQEQPHLQSGGTEAALYPLAIKGRCIFIRRQRPAAHLRHVLPQQRAGAPQNTGTDTHRAGRVVQLDGELFHRLPPQPAGHCTQPSDSRLQSNPCQSMVISTPNII